MQQTSYGNLRKPQFSNFQRAAVETAKNAANGKSCRRGCAGRIFYRVVFRRLEGLPVFAGVVLSGQSAGFYAVYLAVKSFVESGDFTLLGLLADERNPGLPDVPTLKEQGIDLSVPKFFYFAFPKGTPEDVRKTFTDALRNVTKNPEAKKDFEKFLITLDFIEKDRAVEIIEDTKELFAKHIGKIMK